MKRSSVISIFLAFLHSMLYLHYVESFLNCGGVKSRYVCDISNPQAFHICLGDDRHSFLCPGSLHFNAKAQICDWPETTHCPYDNFSGQDGRNEGIHSVGNNNRFKASAFQSHLPSTTDKPQWSGMRTNPYENWYNKKLYHDQNVVDFLNGPNSRRRHFTNNNVKDVSKVFFEKKPLKVLESYKNNVDIVGLEDREKDINILNTDNVYRRQHGDLSKKLNQNYIMEELNWKNGGNIALETTGARHNVRRTNYYDYKPYKKRGAIYTRVKYPRDLQIEKDISKSNDYVIHDQNHDEQKYRNHDSSKKDNENEVIQSYDIKKKTRKRRRKSRVVSNKVNNDLAGDYFRRRAKTRNPFSPPYETYNFNSHDIYRKVSENEVQDKYDTDFLNEDNSKIKLSLPALQDEKRHWYKQGHITNVVNRLENTDSVLETRNVAWDHHSDDKNITKESERQDVTSRNEMNAVPNWIRSYDKNEVYRINDDKSHKEHGHDDSNDDAFRRPRERKSNYLSSPISSRANSKSESYLNNRKNKIISWVDEAIKTQISKQSFHPENRATIYAKPRDIKKSDYITKMAEANYKRSSSEDQVWHPRVGAYRRWPIFEGTKNGSLIASKRNTKVKEMWESKGRKSQSEAVTNPVVMSVHGSRIHPYKPKTSLTNRQSPSKHYPTYYDYTKRKSSRNARTNGKCSRSWCRLPDCRCVGSDIPGDLSRDDVPMMVMLTFDDGVNKVNFPFYKEIFDGSLKNPNGCPVKGTFFVSGDSTDYKLVRRLFEAGHEIASHTLSHRQPTTWWAHAGVQNWEKEVVGMRHRLADNSDIPEVYIQGMRAPFLQVGGDDQYEMLQKNHFRYDSSMVTGSLHKDRRHPVWPFTLDTPPDYKTCNLTPCPTKPYPGLWEVPLIRWYGTDRVPCAMPDSCHTGNSYRGAVAFLEDNFYRHYKSNRAPLGIFIHATWFKRNFQNFEALKDFLAYVLERHNVWLLTASQVLDWVQRPVPLSSLKEMKSWQC